MRVVLVLELFLVVLVQVVVAVVLVPWAVTTLENLVVQAEQEHLLQ
jgi:hypothetical protein